MYFYSANVVLLLNILVLLVGLVSLSYTLYYLVFSGSSAGTMVGDEVNIDQGLLWGLVLAGILGGIALVAGYLLTGPSGNHGTQNGGEIIYTFYLRSNIANSEWFFAPLAGVQGVNGCDLTQNLLPSLLKDLPYSVITYNGCTTKVTALPISESYQILKNLAKMAVFLQVEPSWFAYIFGLFESGLYVYKVDVMGCANMAPEAASQVLAYCECLVSTTFSYGTHGAPLYSARLEIGAVKYYMLTHSPVLYALDPNAQVSGMQQLNYIKDCWDVRIASIDFYNSLTAQNVTSSQSAFIAVPSRIIFCRVAVIVSILSGLNKALYAALVRWYVKYSSLDILFFIAEYANIIANFTYVYFLGGFSAVKLTSLFFAPVISLFALYAALDHII